MRSNDWVGDAIELAIPLIKKFEGFRATPYYCSAGVLTIGYGTTLIDGKPIRKDQPPCTHEQAEEWLYSEVARLAGRLLKSGIQSTSQQFAAFLSFAYNLGLGALLNSTLWRLHKAGRFEEAAAQFGRWVNAGGRRLAGLVLRRAAEASLYSSQTQSN